MQNFLFKSGLQDKRDSGVTTDEIEQFFDAIVDSPQLYPYFMELFPDGL